jgi:glyoxylase-like metal-dependent hydrolase (beta-lactamase superfamily II)
MQLHLIETGYFKLDGGSMFGVVPKRLWSRMHAPDTNNLCTWSMRCLLIQTDGRNILVDTGLGEKQDEKFRSHFEPHGEATLLGSLAEKGLQPEDITDVFLTHLHFDHVGGAVRYDEKGGLVPTFPNAAYWTNQRHYDWAVAPNAREKASFLKENFVPLQEAGVLRFLEVTAEDQAWLPGIKVRFVYGHTEAMMVLLLEEGEKRAIYCADVIPSSFHIGLPYVMAYDVRPLLTLDEKKRILEDAIEQDAVLLFEHDPGVGCCRVVRNERGRIVRGELVDLAGYWNSLTH